MRQPALALLLIPLLACGGRHDDPPVPQPVGSLVKASACKGASGAKAEAAGRPDCLVWSFQGTTLTFQHENAAFNCCPGPLSATFRVDTKARLITVTERETSASCHCNCLYDLEYRIQDLEPGSWHVRVEEPYRPTQEPVLEGFLELKAGASGRLCLERKAYPWNIPATREN